MKSWPQPTEFKFNYLIVAGGRFPPVSFFNKHKKKCEQIIAVDRGADLIKKARAAFDFFVGDLDSLKNIKKSKISKNASVDFLKVSKNMSDLEWALLKYLKNPKKSALVLAAHEDHEGRTDHAFANMLLLLKYPRRLIMASDKNWAMAIKDQKFEMTFKQKTTFSVFAAGDAKVKISGAAYNGKVTNAPSPTHGLSNLAAAEDTVALHIKGSALLFVSAPLK